MTSCWALFSALPPHRDALAGIGIHEHIRQSRPAVALHLEGIDETRLAAFRERNALHRTRDALQRDGSGRVFTDLCFANETVGNVSLLSSEATSGERQRRHEGQ